MTARGRRSPRRALALLGLLLAGCPNRRPPESASSGESPPHNERDQRARIRAELEDEILTSYERDEPPDVETAMLDPRIGPARIGVGPGDVLIGPELLNAPSRWPLDVDPRTPTEARSKRLEVHLALDGTAAWAFDEISWRIRMCGRTAAIPLRMTALFAREGDRWVQVFEHLSFGRIPAPSRDGGLRGAQIRSAVVSSDLVDELSGVLARGQFRPARNASAVSTGPEAMVLGPGVSDEWHSVDVLSSGLPGLGLRAEDRRVGIVGRTLAASTIAYWIGNFVAALPARPGIAPGKARLRGAFVFERRRLVTVELEKKHPRRSRLARAEDESCAERPNETKAERDERIAACRWVLVQGHVSQPIDDGPDASGERHDIVDLTTLVFGTALVSPKPLEVTCDDGSPVKAPAAPSRRPPAAGSR
jgi:hypothetical protein